MTVKTDWKALEILCSAHQAGLGKLMEMETAINRIRQGDAASAVKTLRGLFQFFNGELRVHFSHEEEALFPAISRVIGPMGPVQVMLDEHRILWQAIDELQQALNDYDDEGAKAAERIDRISSNILWTLRSHIEKEDQMLFPMAETQLDRGDKELVTQTMELIAPVDR